MTIKEIQKERIITKQTLPLRSSALEGLLDRAKKLAKLENREAGDQDIILAAKQLIKTAQKNIEILKTATVDQSEFIKRDENEIAIYTGFLPVQVSEEKLRATIAEYIDGNIEEKSMKSMGKVMKMIQYTFGDTADRGLASSITKELLS